MSMISIELGNNGSAYTFTYICSNGKIVRRYLWMDLRGVVIMKNINLQKHYFLNYSQFYFNNQKVKNLSNNYHEILQNRLKIFEEMIMGAFQNLFDFLSNYFNNHLNIKKELNKLKLLEDIIYEYSEYRHNGIDLINQMVDQLNEKEIDQPTFDLLNDIISYQEDITRKILCKELTLERIEVVFEHIKEVPYYLKSDLEIDNLPSKKPIKNSISSKSLDGQLEVVMSYNSNEKQYSVGA